METSDLDLKTDHVSAYTTFAESKAFKIKELFYSYREIFLCSELNSRPQVYDYACVICSDKY